MAKLNCESVLVPTDFSDQAAGAVDIALGLAGKPSHLTVIHVAPTLNNISVGDPAVVWTDIDDHSRREVLLKKLHEQFGDAKFHGVHFEVAFGVPADEITRYAQDHHVDTIVLPSHGRTGLARLMIGSVAERVVRLAHCPVLVLRD